MTYGQEYFQGHNYGQDILRARAYCDEMRRVKERVNPGSVLDIGCGVGGFGALFGVGWQVYGIEPDAYAAGQAREKGIRVVEYEDIATGSLEAVIFRGSIQHIENPFVLIRNVKKLLVIGGWIIFLATPNANSIYYRLWNTLPCLDPPRNYWIPANVTLANVLENYQYSEIEFYYPYSKGPYARPLKDWAIFLMRMLKYKKHCPFPRNMMECYARNR